MNCSTPGLPVHHQLPEFTQIHVHRVGDAISHLILGRPLLLLPPIPPSIKVFSNESTLCMRWPEYWSFSFSIIPSKEIPGLISFRMDWLDLLAVHVCICGYVFVCLCVCTCVSRVFLSHGMWEALLSTRCLLPCRNVGPGLPIFQEKLDIYICPQSLLF